MDPDVHIHGTDTRGIRFDRGETRVNVRNANEDRDGIFQELRKKYLDHSNDACRYASSTLRYVRRPSAQNVMTRPRRKCPTSVRKYG